MTIALSVSDIHVTLGHNHVLKGVALDVRPGEFVTLLGASGSGKSTLLNVIAGLQSVDSGQVLFDGVNVEKRSPQKRNVGVVFQSYALFPHMTIGENVSFPLLAARRPAKERRAVADEMLNLVQLPGMADRSPASLSGGQRQRVALARALAANPGILLLDEPMAALDKQLREQMQVEITRIQRKVGITTVSVTHDQTEALTMSDRVAIMRDGFIVQVDTPRGPVPASRPTSTSRASSARPTCCRPSAERSSTPSPAPPATVSRCCVPKISRLFRRVPSRRRGRSRAPSACSASRAVDSVSSSTRMPVAAWCARCRRPPTSPRSSWAPAPASRAATPSASTSSPPRRRPRRHRSPSPSRPDATPGSAQAAGSRGSSTLSVRGWSSYVKIVTTARAAS